MAGPNAGRSGRNWRKLVELARREMPAVCWICRRPINTALDQRDPMSWTLDHVVPRKTILAHGGDPEDPSNLRPAHRRCNSRKGTGEAPIPPKASRAWG